MTLITRIKKLEKEARALEPDAGRRSELLGRTAAYAEGFLQGLEEAPAFVASEEKGRGLYDSPLSEEGMPIGEILDLIGEHVDRPGVNPASGRFLGYIPGGGLYYAALGDYLAAVANRYAGFFFASPGAARMENLLLEWMGELVGYPPTRAGNLTSGGSIGNLVGIVTARDDRGIAGREVQRAVVYLTEQAHHSVDKALRIAGVDGCVVRRVPVDECYRMSAPALAQAIEQDRKAGLNPWLVVASAGTTNTGAVDPLQEIGQIAADNGLWFHVDGAYGAFFVLCEEGRERLQGMERSDSLVMDPHKTLFLPYGTGAVLVRDRQKLYATHHSSADYMQDALEAAEEFSPADFSPELTKHFRGLRLWLSLKIAGIRPFRAALEEKLLLTRYFHERMREMEGFEVGPPPDLSVATYRYVPQRGDPNAFNARLAEAVQKDGRIFVSSTTVAGTFVLRAAIGVFRTHLEDVDLALEVLAEKARALEST